jgi:hypothetical protein
MPSNTHTPPASVVDNAPLKFNRASSFSTSSTVGDAARASTSRGIARPTTPGTDADDDDDDDDDAHRRRMSSVVPLGLSAPPPAHRVFGDDNDAARRANATATARGDTNMSVSTRCSRVRGGARARGVAV